MLNNSAENKAKYVEYSFNWVYRWLSSGNLY